MIDKIVCSEKNWHPQVQILEASGGTYWPQPYSHENPVFLNLSHSFKDYNVFPNEQNSLKHKKSNLKSFSIGS
jgi:hypothetical protein